MSIVTDVRKAANGLASGCEAYVTRDGVSTWLDEIHWDAEVMDAVFAWRTKRHKRQADRTVRRKPTAPIAKEPTSVAEGPQRGDRIEVCFPGPKRNWHQGVVTHEPYVAPNGRLVYTVYYDGGRVFADHLSLPWRLHSRSEPRDASTGPSVEDRIEVAWPSEIDGQVVGTRWITGKVLSVESVSSDVGTFMRYTVWYRDTGNTFCDRLSLPWRPARTRPARRMRPRTVETEAPLLLPKRHEYEVAVSSCGMFDLNGPDSESDYE